MNGLALTTPYPEVTNEARSRRPQGQNYHYYTGSAGLPGNPWSVHGGVGTAAGGDGVVCGRVCGQRQFQLPVGCFLRVP